MMQEGDWQNDGGRIMQDGDGRMMGPESTSCGGSVAGREARCTGHSSFGFRISDFDIFPFALVCRAGGDGQSDPTVVDDELMDLESGQAGVSGQSLRQEVDRFVPREEFGEDTSQDDLRARAEAFSIEVNDPVTDEDRIEARWGGAVGSDGLETAETLSPE